MGVYKNSPARSLTNHLHLHLHQLSLLHRQRLQRHQRLRPGQRLRPSRMERPGYDPPRRRARDPGSAGCQPARLGSLPRWENGNYPAAYSVQDVAGRASGNYRLAACAPLQFRSARGRF
jgi:hypothetical protein